MRITNLCASHKLPAHELVVYDGVTGELVVAVQRQGSVIIRITVPPHGTPQILVIDPPPGPRR